MTTEEDDKLRRAAEADVERFKSIAVGARKLLIDGFHKIEDTVGKDRLATAAVAAAKVGALGAVGGPVLAFKGAFVGAVAGLIGGRSLNKWLDGIEKERAANDSGADAEGPSKGAAGGPS